MGRSEISDDRGSAALHGVEGGGKVEVSKSLHAWVEDAAGQVLELLFFTADLEGQERSDTSQS